MTRRLVTVLAALAISALAAEPIGTLTASGTVMVNGKPLPTAGVPNWPLALNDEIGTGNTPAAITFPDGVRVTLAPGTRVRLAKCDRCVLQVVEGSVDYAMPDASTFEMCALGYPIQPKSKTRGSVVVQGEQVLVKVAGSRDDILSVGECACQKKPPLIRKKPLLVLVGAGSTGAVLAITSADPKSPNR